MVQILKDCWNHMDTLTVPDKVRAELGANVDMCPGAPKAIVCRLENGIIGLPFSQRILSIL